MDDFDYSEEEEERQQRKEQSEQDSQQARENLRDDVKKFNDNLRKNQASSGTNNVDGASKAASKASKTGDAANKASKAAQGAEKAGQAAKTAETAGKAAKAGKAAATAGKAAAGASTGPVGWVLLGIDAIKLIKAEREKRKNEDFGDKLKRNAPLLILLSIILLPMAALTLTLSVGYEATTYDSDVRMEEYVKCLESKDGCEDLWGFVDEKVEGKGKSLIQFKDDEFEKAGKDFADISLKYFKEGEGFDFKSYDKASGGTMLTEKEQKEILANSVSNYLAIESKAFSRINWYVCEDGETLEKAELKEEFSVGSDEESFFTWLTQLFHKPKYKILIPKPDVYSKIKTTTKHILKEKIIGEKDTTGTEGYKNEDENGLDADDPKVEETDGAQTYDLEYYRKLLTGFLPEWIEPYSMYMATGDIELTNSYTGILYKLMEDEELGLDVVLYRENVHTIRTEEVYLDQTVTTSIKDKDPEVVVTDQTMINKYDTLVTKYTPIVESGYKHNYILKKSGYELGVSTESAGIMPSTTVTPIDFENEITGGEDNSLIGKVVGKGTRTATSKVEHQNDSKSLNFNADKRETVSYEDAINDPKYNGQDNKYINMRMCYVFKTYTKMFKDEYPDIFTSVDENGNTVEVEDPFNLDLIGPALQEVDKYYTKEMESSNASINGTEISADISDVPEGGFLWPTDISVSPSSKKTTSLFGKSQWYFDWKYDHTGIDIVGDEHVTPIRAAQNGQVLSVQKNITGYLENSYGNCVVIGHGTYTTRYAHLSYKNPITVKVGDTVTMGQVIGYMGNTGWSKGTHLHFEIIKNGTFTDPMLYYTFTDNGGTEYKYTHTMTQEEISEVKSANKQDQLSKDDLFQFTMRTKDPLPNNYNYKASRDPKAEEKAKHLNSNDDNDSSSSSSDLTNKTPSGSDTKPNQNLSQNTTNNTTTNTPTNHDGLKKYISSSNVTYYQWKQNTGNIANQPYRFNGTVSTFEKWGCPIVSTTIFLQAFGVDLNPIEIYNKTGALAPYRILSQYGYLGNNKSKLKLFGEDSSATSPKLDKNTYKSKIIDALQGGNPAIIHSTCGSDGHFLTILDYNSSTNQIYISDVSSGYKVNNNTVQGWQDINILFEGGLNINQFIYVSRGENV